MVPQLLALLRSRPRARSRARVFVSPNCAGIENLEERTLLSSATLAILNGNFTGTYKGSITVNNNGTKTTTAVTSTAFQMAINNGAITFTTPSGNGSGTVDLGRNITGTVNVPNNGGTVPVSVVGKITNVNAIQTVGSGTWSFSVNLGGGVTATGSGSWSASAPQVLSNFNGNYAGTYQGSLTVNDHGTKTTTPVNVSPFTAVINNGVMTVTFPSASGVTGSATIDVTGRVTGTSTFTENGVTITVTSGGPASRGMQGVNGSGTWSIKTTTVASGVTLTGSGTYNFHSVLVLDGSYTGTASGNVVENNNGTITNNPIPGSILSNNEADFTISNGTVTVSVPGIPATGTGTIDENGVISGSATFTDDGATITVTFSGQGAPTSTGKVINGTWSFPSTALGGGVSVSGSGTFTATA
ncbi:MAG TPA: hypothetical protein VFG04_11735 [Planctomycetaceae bacterium]|jgi:hypothetical protein|nr:hypothetical protein [Planctomycetaceae bacterium]